MKYKLLFTFYFLSSLTFSVNAQIDSLRNKIAQIIQLKKAEVGVAILGLEEGDTLTLNQTKHYPMQSVYKFHLALAVLHKVDKGKLTLDQKIFIKKSDLLPNTWSPMRDDYPEGNVQISLSELLAYTVSKSDNNGCDILFRLLGGVQKVHQYIRKLGFKDIAIAATEEEMHQAWEVQFTNWNTPFSAVRLLDMFFQKNILSPKSRDFLWKIMVETSTGPDRIKELLPKGTVVAHKTGSSGSNEQGITAATNDIGIVQLPNGKHFAIAVFVSNSKENDESNARIIADISKAVWDYFTKKYK